jgi:hypothetical protein
MVEDRRRGHPAEGDVTTTSHGYDDDFGSAFEDALTPEELVMQTHMRVIAVIHFVMAGGLVLAAIVVTLAVAGGGLLSGDPHAIGVTSAVAFGINVILLTLAAPGLLAGFGLLGLRAWARPLSIVLGVLHLPGFPFGTAFGVYSLWALMSPDTAALFQRSSR